MRLDVIATTLLFTTSLMAQAPAVAPPAKCDMATATPWIGRWFDAWELTANEILHIGPAKPADFVFFDDHCVYTTSPVSAPGAAEVDGPALMGAKLPWRVKAHDGTITLPNGNTMKVGLTSFAGGGKKTGPFFVMSAPEIWTRTLHKSADDPNGFTPVFLHEFAHVRQVRGFPLMGKAEEAWKFKDSFDDDMVQSHFKGNDEYVKAFEAEDALLYRAATAESKDDTRALAREALSMIRARQARWFTGDEAVFAPLDSMWLSLEGSGQWVGYAWLKNPRGGSLTAQRAVEKMRGKRSWWSQDEGLVLFLVVNRLSPDWPSLVFHDPSIGAIELLERAVGPERPSAAP